MSMATEVQLRKSGKRDSAAIVNELCLYLPRRGKNIKKARKDLKTRLTIGGPSCRINEENAYPPYRVKKQKNRAIPVTLMSIKDKLKFSCNLLWITQLHNCAKCKKMS
ncbi:hypothetical protein PR048_019033 [Dryococelus australis]|uniref:Uncharacterized protein n=1 Tax=Dryococelus australis TaxID=614101 RepID=A0ABQ9H2G1_9NEOP|nr:hypothetical protein PR048_019033 [Dryococelus australis]